MANYTPTFTKPYPNGWVDKPSKTTPATAAIMNSYDTAIAALEAYLRDNAIDAVSVSVEQFPSDGRQWIGTITVGSDQYRIYMPSLKYENSVSDGVKIGTITLGDQSFDVYAPTSSAGGSTVSVVPKTLTGTNIAEITVDGTTYQLYAPTGGGSGSTVTAEAILTEGIQIGKITIDGVETILYAPTASPITVDSELSATSENAIQNKAVDAAVKNLQQQIDAGGAGGSVTVDSALSTTSVNPVQNKVVTAELNKKIETLDDESQAPDVVNFDLDSELSLTSVKGVQNKAIAEEFHKYENGTKVVAKATEANTATTASNAEKVNGHTVGADVPSNAVFTDTVYDDSTVKASIQNIVNGTTQVGSATKATQDAQGNVIDTTYAKKTEVPQGTVVDDALSSTSTNPVQNKVVKAEFDKVNSNLDGLGYGDTHGGYNIFKDTTWFVGRQIAENGISDYSETGSAYSDYISIVEPNTYYISSFTHPKFTVFEYDANKSFIKYNGWKKDNNTPCVLSGNCAYIRISFSGASSNIQPSNVMLAKTPNLPYEPYIPSVKMLAEEVNQQKNDLSNLKDGTTSVAKAVADEDGNNIKSTYAKKTEVPSGSIVDSIIGLPSNEPNLWTGQTSYDFSTITTTVFHSVSAFFYSNGDNAKENPYIGMGNYTLSFDFDTTVSTLENALLNIKCYFVNSEKDVLSVDVSMGKSEKGTKNIDLVFSESVKDITIKTLGGFTISNMKLIEKTNIYKKIDYLRKIISDLGK